MKIIISPAKKLNDNRISVENASAIQFLDETKYLVSQLRNYNVDEIKTMMNLSDNLASLNYQRFQQWNLEYNNVIPAIYMFQGDVYKGLKADQLSQEELYFTQDNLRIISGLYGFLRPLDLIFPYRLEMGTNIITNKGDNLYKFWGNKLRNLLISEMTNNEVLINLASNEYSKALQLDKIKQQIITPVFKDTKNGQLKVISFYAKRARGEMVNFIIKNRITSPEELKSFKNNGYAFSEESNGQLLFAR